MQSKPSRPYKREPAHSECDDTIVEPAADGASISERLDYLSAMISGLRGMAQAVPQSSLTSILDSALTEIQLQRARGMK